MNRTFCTEIIFLKGFMKMENLIFCLNATIPIFLTLMLGLFFRKIGLFDDIFVSRLNKFVFNAALPALLFLAGMGLLAGRIHSGLLFGLMALALGAGFIPLPMNIDLYGYSFFTEYPLTMGLLDPEFSMPGGMIVSRVIFLLAGIGFLVFAVWRKKKLYLFKFSH